MLATSTKARNFELLDHGVVEEIHIIENPGDVEELPGGGFFVVVSKQMRELRAQMDQVAKIDVPVLILGESGTGKEVVARMLHEHSNRAKHGFFKLNCAAVPGELLESELFGYERGAFTGAVRSKPGTIEICNHGTLLLDEIGDMPASLQAKLLHVIQDREFSRLGSCARIKADIRIIAATNVDIREAMVSKKFRPDLYYRLGGFILSLPPLRERQDDIPVMIDRYMGYYAERLGLPRKSISREFWRAAFQHTWPGNVRELENVVKRYLLWGDEAPPFVSVPAAVPRETAGLKPQVRKVHQDAEVAAITGALVRTRWNRKEAAKLLQISYKSMLSKIRMYGIDGGPAKQPCASEFELPDSSERAS